MNKNIKINHGLITIIVFIFLFGIVIYLAGNTDEAYVPQPNIAINSDYLKTYSSKSMRFAIHVPLKFQVEEKFFRVTLTSNEGNIYIEKSSTNFENIDDYVNDLDVKNDSVTMDKKKIDINNISSISGFVDGQKYYFIYANSGTIFTLFAESSLLFPALDQIAQSFRYNP